MPDQDSAYRAGRAFPWNVLKWNEVTFIFQCAQEKSHYYLSINACLNGRIRAIFLKSPKSKSFVFSS